jgi:hypothetical protein
MVCRGSVRVYRELDSFGAQVDIESSCLANRYSDSGESSIGISFNLILTYLLIIYKINVRDEGMRSSSLGSGKRGQSLPAILRWTPQKNFNVEFLAERAGKKTVSAIDRRR